MKNLRHQTTILIKSLALVENSFILNLVQHMKDAQSFKSKQ